MLTLGQCSNLMSSIIHSTLELSSHVQNQEARVQESYNSPLDPDPILEDSPDPREDSEVDYTFHPPDVGLNVEIDPLSPNSSTQESPLKLKRVFCSFLSQGASVDSDPDEYPFEAITYGDSISCFGLPYNDHTYASYEEPPNDGRLALLAKLALATDGTSGNEAADIKCTTAALSDVNCVVTTSTTSGVLKHSSRTPLSGSLETSASKASTLSLITTATCVTSAPNRALILQSTHTSVSSPPLQVHRVSSSLTPHIVLRTGIPGLQISTVAPRSNGRSVDSLKPVRCVCNLTHADGRIVQCDRCKMWQHAECISARTRGRPMVPHLCEQCLPRGYQDSHSIVIQRHSASGSVASKFTSKNASARLFVRTPMLSNPTALQANILTTSFSANTQPTISLQQPQNNFPSDRKTVTQTLFSSNTQTIRNSKRKQDLMTFAGSSPNAGLECLTNPSLAHDNPNNQSTLSTKNLWNSPIRMDTEQTGKLGNSIQSLPISDGELSAVADHLNDIADDVKYIGPCSPALSSESSSSIQLSTYEEVTDLRFSESFCQKLDSLYTGSISELPEYFDEESSAELSRLKRCKVVTFDFNRKGVVASENLSSHEPVIEYRGLCMLLAEYNELHDYRKHYNPFVLFYKQFSKIPLCVDARECGNEARFMRRSCTPNCEVRHVLSTHHDPNSGPHIRIRLAISTTRAVPKSTELTIPFDYDYTKCRYLVRCACARKNCSVSRWFRQLNQFDATEGRNLTSLSCGSLPYSRKLQHASSNLTSGQYRSRKLFPNRKQSKKFMERGSNRNTSNISGDLTRDNLDGLEFHSNLKPANVAKHSTKTDKPRFTSSASDRQQNRNLAERNRLKPGGNCGKSFNVNRLKTKKSGQDLRTKKPTKRRLPSHSTRDDSDVQTEPETGDHGTLSVDRNYTPGSRETLDDGSQSESTNRAKVPGKHSVRSPSSRRSSGHAHEDQVKRRRYSSDNSVHEEDKNKTREEIWMAEVLRRIERMEKKQRQSRQRNRSSTSVESPTTPLDNKASPVSKTEKDCSPDKHHSLDANTSLTENEMVLQPIDKKEQTTDELVEPVEKHDHKASDRIPTSTSDKGIQNNRRRRSQTSMLSDNLSDNSKANADSREDRWLKSQLRRIQQLETQPPRPVTARKLSESAVSPNQSCMSTPSGGLSSMHSTNQKQPIFNADSETQKSRASTTSKQSTTPRGTPRKHPNPSKACKRSASTSEPIEADCELIVYRVQDEDPMIKFSRSRSLDVSAAPLSPYFQENLPSVNDSIQDSAVFSCTNSSFTASPAQTVTPRPTKKRWLSQALMEEDNEMLAIANASMTGITTTPAQSMPSDELTSPVPRSEPCPALSAMNPKKRIISQLTEENNCIPNESNSFTPMPEADQASCMHQNPLLHLSDDGSSNNTTAAPPTPLPPKKATVRKQSEEMRKVRVSLSEYRRRKGFPVSESTGHNAVKNTKDEADAGGTHASDTSREVLSIPTVLSPNRLLDEIPKLYQQLRLPEKAVPPLCKSETLSNGLHLDATLSRPGSLITEDEGGPRTPSEPIDEDEGDFTGTMYVQRDSGLEPIAEECDDSHEILRSPHSDHFSNASSSMRQPSVDVIPDRQREISPYAFARSQNSWNEERPRELLDRSHRMQSRRWDITVSSTCSSPSFTSQTAPPNYSNNRYCTPQRRHSGSTNPTCPSPPSSLDYFIKRDQKIRYWQETQSFSWNGKWRADAKSDHRMLPYRSDATRKNHHSSRNHHHSTAQHTHEPNDHTPLATGRLLDVEETLNRLQECLRSQLDRTRHAINPHITPSDRLRPMDYDVLTERTNNRFGRLAPYAEEKFSGGFSYG